MEETEGKLQLKNVVEGVSVAYKYFLGKWKIIVICGVLGTALGITYAYMKKPVYKAILTFALEEKGGAMSSYAGLASQFGIDLGGNGNGGAFVGENLLELLRSRFLVEKTLLTPIVINGKQELLINRYIELNKLGEKLEEQGVRYTIDQPREQFTLKQDSFLHITCNNVVVRGFEVRKVDKKLNIVVVQYESIDELFAKYFTTTLVKNASEFYIETKTSKTKANVMLLEKRVDSVRTALDEQMYGAAINQDRNQNPIRAEGKIGAVKNQMNVQILTTLYGELIKNLELSKFTLMREEPLVQVIDRPILPLEKKKPGKMKSGIAGGFIAGSVAMLYLFLRRTYKKLMYEDAGK